MLLRMEGIDGYDWRAPEVTAHWDKVRADIAAGKAKDTHEYRNDNTADHAHFMVKHHIEKAAFWARKVAEIEAQS